MQQAALAAFVRRLVRLRLANPVLHRRKYFQGRLIRGAEVKDIVWLAPEGREMTDEEWHRSYARCLGLYLAGEHLDEYDQRGQRLKDDNFLLLFNAHHEEIAFQLPRLHDGSGWEALLDTDHAGGLRGAKE